ncbi:MAG: DUF1614 domain-containing protein [Thermoplasmata archaeon]|nr:MAG: DUF1614 domain-containing protein [Thermoplasmata archaeon]
MFHLIALFLFAIIFFFIYYFISTAFEEVGFRWWEASMIVFSSIIFGTVNIPLLYYKNWSIGINVGGALLPIIISIYLTLSRKVAGRSIIGILIVAYVAYNVTTVSNNGVVSPFPYWLLPPMAASLYSLLVGYKSKKKAASIAYISGTLGVLLGADLLHLNELISRDVPRYTMASIGGAAILDMVFLTGIIAILIDGILYGKD